MNETVQTFDASCHCGAIGYRYSTALPPSQWSVRECQCSFCRAHGARNTSDPAGRVEFFERSAGALNRYRFGLHTADFLICRNCGVYLGALIDTERGRFATINLNALGSPLADLPTPVPFDFDAESTAQRIARRERRWTPVNNLTMTMRRFSGA